MCARILKRSGNASKYPGVAKFGIALEWGSRGLEFESRHSDQEKFRFLRKTELFIAFYGPKVGMYIFTRTLLWNNCGTDCGMNSRGTGNSEHFVFYFF